MYEMRTLGVLVSHLGVLSVVSPSYRINFGFVRIFHILQARIILFLVLQPLETIFGQFVFVADFRKFPHVGT